jgi:hypothetical protein
MINTPTTGQSRVKAIAVPAPALVLPPFSLKAVLPWLIFAALLMLVAFYFLTTEQGAVSLLSGNAVHEWVHDGRHLLGFPCH